MPTRVPTTPLRQTNSRSSSWWSFAPIAAAILLCLSAPAWAQYESLGISSPKQQTTNQRPLRQPNLAAPTSEQVAIPPMVRPSMAQPPTTRLLETPSASILEGILREGSELESGRRWSEALTHYEQALREHPGDTTLMRRQDLAKLHYSLDRRYSDRSYLNSVRSLSTQQSLSLYLELLRKVHTHYVNTPPWQRLGVRGVTSLDIALTDDSFRKANAMVVSRDQLEILRRELYQLIGNRPVASPQDLTALAGEVARLAESRIGLNGSATVLEFVTAAAGGLDDYSAYLTADQLRDVYSQIEGNFVGLGVELKADNGALLIVHVIPGSPAERAGILDGDRIIAVDGLATEDMTTDQAASMLTGAEGSSVRVAAVTPGQTPRQLTVRREHVDVPSLEGEKIVDPDAGIAYLRIPAFQKTTARDLDAALWRLHAKGMRSLILDLRGNPGGLLTASVEVADKFLQKGGIVSTRGRNAQEDFKYQAHYGGTWRVPLVVLIDGDSASASEIFAGAIKDNKRGAIIGEKSYGKGSVQGIFPLGYAGAGIRLTTALFYSPHGTKISKRGVSPDNAPIRTVAKPIDGQINGPVAASTDHVLQLGIAAARNPAGTRRVGAARGRDAAR
ncbi:putative CtpA-like serine protease [Adhaeretor mobilis]|uniref:Putative CtpA-like serine protease n=2 Tax=Adhaeretor mobilis TaxID=1930276 RepID=A0A517MQI1_9BACT|nr:putative CtpA-like serine protease [Adhaeretor mobilis]